MTGFVEGRLLDADLDRQVDVCIVGSGAGGSVLAARLAQAGLDVLVLEEGGLHGRNDFLRPDERWSYPNLYQERGARSTADLAITVLQGRAVGGGTLVNWTTCFRTPDRILAHWRREHGTELTSEVLAPHFEAVEARLGIEPWPEGLVNANNDVLRRGCTMLGWETVTLSRNVRGCANTGMCGLGCPVDAKQAMHLTFLADAVAAGATVISDARVDRLEQSGGRVVRAVGSLMERGADRPGPRTLSVRAKVFVSAGGAINGPALLLRSGLSGGGRVGRRTFLHPVTAMIGQHAERVAAFSGAPQSVSSHHHVDRGPEEYGFFLEVAPMQPMLIASAGWTGGPGLNDTMQALPNLSNVLALQVDGLLVGDEGGTVSLKPDGRARLDYPIGPALVRSMRDAHLASARIQLAAGALAARSSHVDPVFVRSEADLPKLGSAAYGAHQHGIFSAHQMGGCGMGADPTRHVIDLQFRYRGLDNLFVVDGSALPTALGVNPSQTIYGLAHFAADHVRAAVG
jgi:choline dehydrogenase-like flavoprotein